MALIPYVIKFSMNKYFFKKEPKKLLERCLIHLDLLNALNNMEINILILGLVQPISELSLIS